MEAQHVIVKSGFDKAEFDWLSRQAERRGIDIPQFICLLIEQHGAQAIWIAEPVTVEEFARILTDQVRTLVRNVRCSIQ